MNKRVIVGLLFLAVAIGLCLPYFKRELPRVCVKDYCVDVKLADTAKELQKGLQGHALLKPNEGMLFVFKENGYHRFWMKSMSFPIDIIWLDKDWGIVSIGESLPACVQDPCTIYAPDKLARYVLEVSAGFARRHALKAGDHVVFR